MSDLRAMDPCSMVKLGDVCAVLDAAVDPQKNPDEEFAHYSIPAFDSGHGPVMELGREIHSNKLELQNGSVLFSKLNPRIPRVWHVQDDIAARRICSTEFLVLQPDAAVVNSVYLTWMLQTPVFLHAVRSRVQAATKSRERVPDDVVLSTSIPLPPLPEQKRVAVKLDEQMATLASAQAALVAQREAAIVLRSAVLRTALDPAPHPEWRSAKLGEISRVSGGSTPDSSNAAYWNGDIMWVTPVDLGRLHGHHLRDSERHITREGFRSASVEMIPANSVIMSSRAPIGYLAISDVPVATNQGCKSFTPGSGLDTSFLYYALETHVPDLRAIGGGATFTEVSKSKLEQYAIQLPSLSEQKRIAGYLDSSIEHVDTLIASIDVQATTLDSLRASLLNAAFSGQV